MLDLKKNPKQKAERGKFIIEEKEQKEINEKLDTIEKLLEKQSKKKRTTMVRSIHRTKTVF